MLRGLVPNRRRDPALQSWHHENLLFICATTGFERITFTHFRGDKHHRAKLTTFGWEKGSACLRTLLEHNLPKLAWPDDESDSNAWLKQWTKAFDKEPLAKEFFKRFQAALERVKGDLQELQNLDFAQAYSRSQLLLERLLFLYFLQNRDFLPNRFEPFRGKPDECTFYSEFLEKLFWTLASAPGSQARLTGIPFLNGGLFDDDEFAPTPLRMKNDPPLQVRNSSFAHLFANLLEAFNFTVREDTPLNQDVAVDPEMLGNVFESIVLHAEAADPVAVAPDAPSVGGLDSDVGDLRLSESDRPFRLWAKADGDSKNAVTLIPADWPIERKQLWEARLTAIHDNEHIRRIEAPVYKRRWDEQWKVGNRWTAGPPAYAQEFADAFFGWLAEKAEWHLEHKANGGPIAFDAWASALWKDTRIQAAWLLAAEKLNEVELYKAELKGKSAPKKPSANKTRPSFEKHLKAPVKDNAVPDGISPAVPWDELAKKIRGNLNVPRERFHIDSNGNFIWAGKNKMP